MLQIQHLIQRYGRRRALDDLSLELPAAELVAPPGPNGAGKSTPFQVLTGLFVADEGQAIVHGHSPRGAATQALRPIGVVFQRLSLDLGLSVRANLRFHAGLHGLPRASSVPGCWPPGSAGLPLLPASSSRCWCRPMTRASHARGWSARCWATPVGRWSTP